MPVSIFALVPNADDLLQLEVEEIAGVLLAHLNSRRGSDGDAVAQHGLISLHNFFREMDQLKEYGVSQAAVNRALMEGWSWLQNEGFLIQQADQTSGWFFLSRRAIRLRSREDFESYRKANLLPKGQLHPMIAAKVYPAFLRGEYDTAVFQAFRELEIAVRSAGNYPPDIVGKDLIRAAFRPANPEKPEIPPGPLTDATLPISEQEGMAHLFDGAIRLYKNPQSHRHVPTDAVDAAEIIVFASHLLRMVDKRA